ncbi:MAG: hypothetical protein A2W29_08945 [Gemmatimonadetes bacterium RBG_16_66_8]|nr:MAG: hypothetical protein A2W29_08945 [Gemmatimonadetes bacterium RBG_16_66_8]
MSALTLYHRTSIGEARQIVKDGFQDQKWGFSVDDAITERHVKAVGVWLTDRLLDADSGPPGDAMLEVFLDLNESSLKPFELDGMMESARLWVVPAQLLNPHSRVRILRVDPRSSGWFDRREFQE